MRKKATARIKVNSVPDHLAETLRCCRCDEFSAPLIIDGRLWCLQCCGMAAKHMKTTARNPQMDAFIREAVFIGKQMSRTNGRPAHLFSWRGETKQMTDWAKEFKVTRQALWLAKRRHIASQFDTKEAAGDGE